MIKLKEPLQKIKNVLGRKPSLPIKRNSSALSNQSCLSDRIVYKKNLNQELPPKPLQVVLPKANAQSKERTIYEKNSEKSQKRIRPKIMIGAGQMVKKCDHSLTGFQWLIIMRHCFHIENKKRSVVYIKQRTLVNYIKNRLYPDSLWNKILVIANEQKFTPEDIIKTLQKQSKGRLTLDDIMVCIGRNFHVGADEHESAAETARFVENMKSNEKMHENICRPKLICKQAQNESELNNSKVILSPMDSIDMSQFELDSRICLNISPISCSDPSDPTNNISEPINISFSMQQSSQSQISQSANDKFQSSLSQLQSLKRNLTNSKMTQQKSAIISFINQLTAYSIYKENLDRLQNSKKKVLNLSNIYFHGLKLQDQREMSKISKPVLKKLFQSREFINYFHCLTAIKISQFSIVSIQELIPMLSPNLKILNLSHNDIRSVSFVKAMNTGMLQFINFNHNRITNISELLNLNRLQEIHVKGNLIDHVSSDKVTAKKLRIIDLSWNQIQKEEDLWSLRSLPSLTMINLSGNQIMKANKWVGLINRNIILDYSQLYIFSAYTQEKDIAFETKNKQGLSY